MEVRPELGPVQAKRRAGDEVFRDGDRELGFDLSSFWQWCCSDLISNATRGILAEYLVAQALGVAGGVRDEWAAYDLTTADGIRIEVKSAAYIQSWKQEALSAITFRVPKTRGWDEEAKRYGDEARRQADVYVFAVLAHQVTASIDPMDVSQWMYFVVPTALLDARARSQHSITLNSLRAVAGEPVAHSDLRRAVQVAAGSQRPRAAEGPAPDRPAVHD